jgi:carbonic anhydrase
MEIQDVINRLQEGNARFVEDRLEAKLQDVSRREELADHQAPYAIILSCADSRVIPELAFDAGIGELFVVRVAGNIANTSSLASIEYAVAHCHSIVIVVLGHQSCGAVTAAVDGGVPSYSLNHLLSHISPALGATERAEGQEKGDYVNAVVRKNAEMTAAELISRSTIISDAVNAGKVAIAPAYYNLGSGRVDFL